MSLIEILLVVTLVGIIFANVAPSLGKVFRTNTKSTVRKFSSLVRYAYDQSILTGLVHRIVVDLDRQEWKIQNALPGVLPSQEIKEKLTSKEDIENNKKEESKSGFKDLKNAPNSEIPGGVAIVEAGSWRLGDKMIQSGQLGIYAFPNGFIDEAQVVLAERGKEDVFRYKITTTSLTGRVKVETDKPQ